MSQGWPRRDAQRAPRAQAIALAAILLVSLRSGPADAGALRVNVDTLPCTDLQRLASSVARKTTDLLATAPDLDLSLGWRGQDFIEVRLSGGGSTLERRMPFRPTDCAVVPQLAALIVRGWVGRRWDYPMPVAAEHATPDPAADPPREPVLARVEVETPQPAQRIPSVRVLLQAGIAGAPAASGPGTAVQASLDWDLARPWGLAGEAGYDTGLSAPVRDGRVEAALWSAALLGRWSPPVGKSAFLDLLAGPGLEIVSARSEGIATPMRSTIPVASLHAAARWRQRLAGPLALVAGLECALLARQEAFHVVGYGPVFKVTPVRLRATAGLAWDLD